VDPEIERGLREILEFFKVDRCALLQILPDETSWQITHVAAQESVPPVPQGTILPVSINPWAYDKLIRKREVLSVSRLDDLPVEANVDRQTWDEWGIRSNLNIPIILGGPVDHVFAINSVKSERVWPEEFIPRLRLLGEILVNALERKQIRLQIEERLRFEGLISNLSAGFVNLPSDRFESQINRELRSITEFFDVGRCSIGLFSEDGTQLARAFEYHSAEAEPTPGSMSKEQIPWFIGQLIQGKPVVMNRVEDLPPEAEKERQLCLLRGMKSLLAVPMLSEGKTLGSCALVSIRAERVWREELVQRFRLISEVFASALERKRAEQEAYDARRELTRMERLSRMGELSASLSHELNQPLTAILSNARAALRFLHSGKLDLAELEEILQDIVKDDKRAGDIIRNLRAMVKPEEGEQELTSINDVLHETVALFRSEAIIRNVRIETDLADALPPLHVNKVQIQQVLINLMTNAAESMTGEESAERIIVLRTAASGEGVVKVAVRDFGSGIEEQALQRIFEPFFTTKRSGLGMGLSLSRSIIESHGGHIWAENNPDKGITFYFDLPGSRGER
jgi:signal transduction histidine kinase